MIIRLGSLVMGCLLLLLVTAGPASAHHADVSATVSCTGRVSFTSTAWRGESVASRSNAEIRVSYSTDGVRFVALPNKPAYAFAAADAFTFTDTFQLSRPLPRTVVVAAQAVRTWADGAPPGAAQKTASLAVPRCSSGAAPRAAAQPPAAPPSPAASTSARPSPSASGSPTPTAAASSGASTGAVASGGPHAAAASAAWRPTPTLVVTTAVVGVGVLAAGGWALWRIRRG